LATNVVFWLLDKYSASQAFQSRCFPSNRAVAAQSPLDFLALIGETNRTAMAATLVVLSHSILPVN
ncbi:MAG: hypothetical protein ABW100_11865, partial [Candidatus Thiodiazotropha sp. 6PLUC3]